MTSTRSTVRPSVFPLLLAALTILLIGCSGSAPVAETASSSAAVESTAAPTSRPPTSTTATSLDSTTATGSTPAVPTPPSSSELPPPPSSFVPPAPPAPVITGPVLPASRPTVLEVPSIGVRSDLLDLGQNADGTIQVPDVDDPNSPAGWYNGSPTPGEPGPAILLGHVDSRALGPGVFYDLGSLQPGAEVRVTREDGTVAIFQVDRVQSYAKLDFPTLTVYGNLDHAGLRLITCGGVFDADAGSYESNIIAFASLVGQA